MMGRPPIDMIGQRYGDYVILAYVGRQRWLLRCKCGARRSAHRNTLRDGIARRHCNHGKPRLLTPRQFEVARLVAEGLQSKQIARQLGCTRHTVKNHMTHIFAKLGVKNRTSLAVLIELGLLREGAEGERKRIVKK